MHITRIAALDAMGWAVEQRGEGYVDERAAYGSCRYVLARQPSCLVGMALHHLGVDLDLLSSMDAFGLDPEAGRDPAISADGRPYLEENGVTMDDQALGVFKQAQIEQDKGNTWGTALEVARAF
jgi:hypothetical protein